MMLALGAATSAIDSLFGLVSAKQTPSAGAGQDQANLFAFQADAATSTSAGAASAAGGHARISPETMSALLTAQGQSGASFTPMGRGEALKDLFARIDADGDGKITKGEFEDALGAGGTNLEQADDVFGKLDKDGDGSVSLNELASALMPRHARKRGHDGAANGVSEGGKDPLLAALDGATGSTVTMTKPATSSAATAATSSYNFLEQLIQRQANTIAAQASSSLSLSV